MVFRLPTCSWIRGRSPLQPRSANTSILEPRKPLSRPFSSSLISSRKEELCVVHRQDEPSIKMDKLVLHGRRSSMLKTSTALPSLRNTLRNSYLQYSTDRKEESSQGIGQRARSTAEEFCRQAKERTEKISETAKEVWEDAKEAVADETQQDKKFKEKVEKGNYDKIGRE